MKQSASPTARLLYRLLAYTACGLGLIGLFLPVMPTAPFMIVAVWAGARGSPELRAWLLAHPQIGPPLRHWDEQRAIGTRAKILALASMAGGFAVLLWRFPGTPIPWAVGAVMAAVSVYVVSRPAPTARQDP